MMKPLDATRCRGRLEYVRVKWVNGRGDVVRVLVQDRCDCLLSRLFQARTIREVQAREIDVAREPASFPAVNAPQVAFAIAVQILRCSGEPDAVHGIRRQLTDLRLEFARVEKVAALLSQPDRVNRTDCGVGGAFDAGDVLGR